MANIFTLKNYNHYTDVISKSTSKRDISRAHLILSWFHCRTIIRYDIIKIKYHFNKAYELNNPVALACNSNNKIANLLELINTSCNLTDDEVCYIYTSVGITHYTKNEYKEALFYFGKSIKMGNLAIYGMICYISAMFNSPVDPTIYYKKITKYAKLGYIYSYHLIAQTHISLYSEYFDFSTVDHKDIPKYNKIALEYLIKAYDIDKNYAANSAMYAYMLYKGIDMVEDKLEALRIFDDLFKNSNHDMVHIYYAHSMFDHNKSIAFKNYEAAYTLRKSILTTQIYALCYIIETGTSFNPKKAYELLKTAYKMDKRNVKTLLYMCELCEKAKLPNKYTKYNRLGYHIKPTHFKPVTYFRGILWRPEYHMWFNQHNRLIIMILLIFKHIYKHKYIYRIIRYAL